MGAFNTIPPNPFPPSSEQQGDGGSQYELPIASAETLGGVKVGTGLAINAETGELSNSNPSPYSLPIASAETLGGVRVGTGLAINAETGELSNSNPTPYAPPAYSTSEVNTGVKWIDGKDIYCKTFHFTEESEQTSKSYDITSLNADFVMLRDPVYKLGAAADNLVVSNDQYLNNSYNRAMTADKTTISVTCVGWGFIEVWCNFYYTKATTPTE